MKKKLLIPSVVVLVLLIIVGIFWHQYNKTCELIDEMLLDEITFVDKDILRSPIFNRVLDKRLTKLVEDAKSPTFIFSLSEDEKDDWFDLGIDPLHYFENMLEIFEKNSIVMDAKTEEIINKHFMVVVEYLVEKKGIKPITKDILFFHASMQRSLAMDYLETKAADELASLQNQYIQDNDATLFHDTFMPLMIFYEEAFSSINYEDYLDSQELKEFLKSSATETICTDGLGGYYDNRKNEYLAEDYSAELLASNLFAEVHQEREKTYLFYGDFMIKLLHTRVSVSNTEFYNWLANTSSDDKDVFVSNIKMLLYYKGKAMSQSPKPVSYGNKTKSVFLIGDIPIAVGDTFLIYRDEIIHLR